MPYIMMQLRNVLYSLVQYLYWKKHNYHVFLKLIKTINNEENSSGMKKVDRPPIIEVTSNEATIIANCIESNLSYNETFVLVNENCLCSIHQICLALLLHHILNAWKQRSYLLKNWIKSVQTHYHSEH